MKTIKYVGTSTYRHLGSEDFDKMGLEGEGPATFTGQQTQEFKNSVAEILLTSPLVAGEFEEVEVEAKSDAKAKEKAPRASSDQSIKGTDQS